MRIGWTTTNENTVTLTPFLDWKMFKMRFSSLFNENETHTHWPLFRQTLPTTHGATAV